MAQTSDSESMHVHSITGGTSPSRATYMAVAEAKECDALTLPPLAETIDPDAVDAIVTADAPPEDVSVEFDYAGCSVTVTPAEVRVSTD